MATSITATYSCGATNGSPAGTYAIAPSLVDPNNRQTNYSVTLLNGTLTVGQSTATITWTNPSSIVYGTALSSNQLNATANVPGNFIYDPTNGALLNSGPIHFLSHLPRRTRRTTAALAPA